MSRLLFAAARGARVQYQNWNDAWVNYNVIPLYETGVEFRIHPEDVYLQYGPISSALRKSAIEGTLYAHAGIPYIMGEYDFGNENVMAMMVSQTHRGVFKLILAEALADEGL